MTTPTTELTRLVADAVTAFGSAGLDADVGTAAKRYVLDTVATMLAATTLGAGCGAVLDLVRDADCAPRSAIVGTGLRTSAPLAALANGATAHALNFDDAGEIHLGVTTIPAALAVAGGRAPTSGRDALSAIAAGMELMARLGRCLSTVPFPDEGHPQPTQMPGYFAAAAAAGRVLGLDAAGLRSAFGVALLQAAGARQNLLDGRAAKSVYAGFAAQGGVQAALLAANGLDADCDAFAGASGLFATYYRDGVDPTPLTAEWTEPLLLSSSFKPWPTTAAGHPQLRAALALHTRFGARMTDISAVTITGHARALTFTQPAARKQQPASSADAEDSVFFPVAKALLHGRVTLADIHSPQLHEPAAAALGALMSFAIDETMGRDDGAVELVFTDGSSVRQEHRVADLTVMTYDESVAKFIDCASHSATPLSSSQVERAIDLIGRLEELDDIAVLVDVLSPVAVAA
jgi:2-methylcitrate dehydratase PrpD